MKNLKLHLTLSIFLLSIAQSIILLHTPPHIRLILFIGKELINGLKELNINIHLI